MKEEIAKALREPFPPEDVGKLPRITCYQCRESPSKACNSHPKHRCDECGNWISPKHIHLDYVGHAELTDRLLKVDPDWNWEPVSIDEHGAPLLDSNGGMWIRLTVGGITRLGYGHPDGKRGGDAIKETIGDALRNAAMRFGVALDLWRREPAQLDHPEPSPADQARDEIRAYCTEHGIDLNKVAADFTKRIGKDIRVAAEPELKDYLALLQSGLFDGGAE